MAESLKYCLDCRHSYTEPERPKYKLCDRAEGEGDARLCGEMRQGACGPDATLWEARDGQA